MHSAAQVIGSSAATQAKIQDVENFRKKIRHDNWHITKIKVKTIVRFGGSLRKEEAQSSNLKDDIGKPKRSSSTLQPRSIHAFPCECNRRCYRSKNQSKAKMTRYLKKVHGGSAYIPPFFSNSQILLTFVGVFITHLILSRLD
ncbi:hypothetical protein ACHAXN_009021 [Cyclotella atomus]